MTSELRFFGIEMEIYFDIVPGNIPELLNFGFRKFVSYKLIIAYTTISLQRRPESKP